MLGDRGLSDPGRIRRISESGEHKVARLLGGPSDMNLKLYRRL